MKTWKLDYEEVALAITSRLKRGGGDIEAAYRACFPHHGIEYAGDDTYVISFDADELDKDLRELATSNDNDGRTDP